MQWLLTTSAGRTIVGIAVATVAVLASIAVLLRIGASREKQRNEIKLRREGWLADRRMDHADDGFGASDDDNREWLRERGQRGRNR